MEYGNIPTKPVAPTYPAKPGRQKTFTNCSMTIADKNRVSIMKRPAAMAPLCCHKQPGPIHPLSLIPIVVYSNILGILNTKVVGGSNRGRGLLVS